MIRAAVLAWMMVACGGRSELLGYDTSPTGATDGGFDSTTDGAPLDLCDPDGIRICGDGCPELITPDSSTVDVDASDVCPGYGCVRAEDIRDFTPQTAGVCWADAQSIAKFACGTCNDGEVCVQRSANDLVCVPEDVCRALWTLGVTDVCRYADFHPYDGRAVPTPTTTCPIVAGSTGPQRVCAGACPACPQGERCVGRSPDHPFGLCRDDFVTGSDPQPSDFQTCKVCLASTPAGTYACAVFDTAAADASLAHAGGLCMPRKDCLEIGAILPGGLSCYDASGNRIGP